MPTVQGVFFNFENLYLKIELNNMKFKYKNDNTGKQTAHLHSPGDIENGRQR